LLLAAPFSFCHSRRESAFCFSLLYVALAKLPAEAAEEVARTTWTSELDHAQRIIASQDENRNWIVKSKAA
jgi:hypothetical protein